MDPAKRSDDSASHSLLVAPPPLPPGAVRLQVLDTFNRYRQVWPAWSATLRPGEPASSLQVYEGDPTRHESDDQIRFRQVRQTALKNLQKLEVFTRRLENKLTDSRIQKWITNGAIALAAQVLITNFIYPLLSRFYRRGGHPNDFVYRAIGGIQNRSRSVYLGMVNFLQWFAYPIAIFQISRHEKRITDTSNLRQDLLSLLNDVEQCRALPDEIPCLSDANWETIPWQLLEGS